MMFQLKKTQVNTDKAPAAIGPYSQAVIAGPFVFTSGQLPVDPTTNELVGGDAANQARQGIGEPQGSTCCGGNRPVQGG